MASHINLGLMILETTADYTKLIAYNIKALDILDEEEGLCVRNVSTTRRAELEANESFGMLEEHLVNWFMKFTKVVQHLIKSRMPLVGHNYFLDLIKMYKQFKQNLLSKF